ncbi:MAG: aspartyl-tRNA(Asn)/glutamyl-tRNA(Gln) amidotransferase subunit B [Candidatus Paceibacteria bacterium]|jgi:aspartyl-tRNA(Asn)/glutamyl-tRNA(Gln) amidotransferase subunit B
MKAYKVTIGLEIHAELKTNTKMFCNSKNDADETKPNVNVCPVCMGHPGTLPVINKQAVEHVIRVGLAIGGDIADFTEFDRKNYFYPDIPKGYQISQYKYPIVSGGNVDGFDITRIHLEEDTGTSKHDKGDFSLVDYNRAGVPLMELVTEPVIHTAEDAVKFAKNFQLLLRYLNVSDANMEKGEMRVEANISISDTEEFGTKVEVKNLNSFKAVEGAINFEVARMTKLQEEGRGDEIVQETRGWNETKQKTFSQRLKESSDDYRYFPEPDLPKLKLHEVFDLKTLEENLPTLPGEKKGWYLNGLSLDEKMAEIFVSNVTLGEYFDEIVVGVEDKKFIKLASNYITSDLVSLLNDEGSLPEVSNFKKLVEMIQENKISSRGAKDILAIMVKEDGDPEKIADDKGLAQQSDVGALEVIVDGIISDNKAVVEDYRGGKEASLQFLVGQGMKATKGSANPQVLKEVFVKKIG